MVGRGAGEFDFLGLKTLTVLDVAVKLLRQRNIQVDLPTLPIDDAPSYQMLARGDVVGVFQVESQGMRRALIDMRPDRFEDIIALVALYRPGPWQTSRPLGGSTATRSGILHPVWSRPQGTFASSLPGTGMRSRS